VIWASILTWN
jgi:hypothetical protein